MHGESLKAVLSRLGRSQHSPGLHLDVTGNLVHPVGGRPVKGIICSVPQLEGRGQTSATVKPRRRIGAAPLVLCVWLTVTTTALYLTSLLATFKQTMIDANNGEYLMSSTTDLC